MLKPKTNDINGISHCSGCPSITIVFDGLNLLSQDVEGRRLSPAVQKPIP